MDVLLINERRAMITHGTNDRRCSICIEGERSPHPVVMFVVEREEGEWRVECRCSTSRHFYEFHIFSVLSLTQDLLQISDHLRRAESFRKDSKGFQLSKRVTQFIKLNEFATKT